MSTKPCPECGIVLSITTQSSLATEGGIGSCYAYYTDSDYVVQYYHCTNCGYLEYL